MANISVVITQDSGEIKAFDLSPVQSNILKDHLCIGSSAATDVVGLVGSREWAIKREGLCDAELNVFRKMFDSLRDTFTRRL